MISISIIWFIVKRAPRFFALAVDIVAIFLLIFLLVGNNSTSQVSTYLTSFEFDSSSPMYRIITSSFSSNNSTSDLQNVAVRAGYMGICVTGIPSTYSEKSTLCYSRKNISNAPLYDDLDVKVFNIRSSNSSSTQPTQLNILQLAEDSSVRLIHPYVLMAVIVLTIVMFCCTLFATIPKLPGKTYLNRFLLALCPVLTLIWGIGAMWTHVAIHASSNYIPHASMGILKVKMGYKASAMAWAAFAFLNVNCLILWALYFRDRRSLSNEIDRIRKPSARHAPNDQSDGSTLASKY
ncbi:FIG1-like protein [Lachancea thermotolerans]